MLEKAAAKASSAQVTDGLPPDVYLGNSAVGRCSRSSPRWRWVAQHHDRQCRAACHRGRSQGQRGGRGLGDQCLSVRHRRFAAAAGCLGDIVGHERIYLVGVLLFTLASLACACAWSLPSLLVARTLQGLGASATMAVNTASSGSSTQAECWGRGFGHNAMVICGIGFGFFQTPNMRAIMTSAPPHRGGSANSIVATGRLIGQTIGAAFAACAFRSPAATAQCWRLRPERVSPGSAVS
jgi:hypothetical protein